MRTKSLVSRKALVAALALSVVPLPASANNFTLSVTPNEAQTIRYDRGTASIDSIQPNSIVRIVNLAGTDQKAVSFVIGIVNAGGRPLNFGPENVTVRVIGLKSIQLTTYEQALETERKKQARDKFWAGVRGFGRALAAADAGNTYSSGSYSGTANGFVGDSQFRADTTGSFSTSTYDSRAAWAAQREAREMNASDRANLEMKWAGRLATANNLLRTTTVDPGMMYGGIARFPITDDLKRVRGPIQVEIEVVAGGEKHTFIARLADTPLSAAEVTAYSQRAPTRTAKSAVPPANGPTLAVRLQSTVNQIRPQLPMTTGGNGRLIGVRTQGSSLTFVMKFEGASVPPDGKVKLHEVCGSDLLAPLLQQGATLHAVYLGKNSTPIGGEDVYPADCGIR